MVYRVCKSFEIESGHMLSKHPGRCRFPHGHSRRVEVVLVSQTLDANDMVCDFKAIKLAIGELLDAWDHAMALNSDDPRLEAVKGVAGDRVVVFQGEDPTTEALARRIYEHVAHRLASGGVVADEGGVEYRFPESVRVERVRVGETSSSWAEYGVPNVG